MTNRRMFNASWYTLPVLLLTLVTLSTGCSAFSADGEESGGNAPLGPLSYESLSQSAVSPETIDRGAYGGDLLKGTRQVIRDEDAFSTFWNSLHGSAPPPLPNIDFSEQVVLAVVLGERPTGGYEAEITNITRNTNPTLIRAFVTETVPGDNCGVTQAITVPYHIVKVDAVDTDQIVFPDNGTQTNSCVS